MNCAKSTSISANPEGPAFDSTPKNETSGSLGVRFVPCSGSTVEGYFLFLSAG